MNMKNITLSHYTNQYTAKIKANGLKEKSPAQPSENNLKAKELGEEGKKIFNKLKPLIQYCREQETKAKEVATTSNHIYFKK